MFLPPNNQHNHQHHHHHANQHHHQHHHRTHQKSSSSSNCSLDGGTGTGGGSGVGRFFFLNPTTTTTTTITNSSNECTSCGKNYDDNSYSNTGAGSSCVTCAQQHTNQTGCDHEQYLDEWWSSVTNKSNRWQDACYGVLPPPQITKKILIFSLFLKIKLFCFFYFKKFSLWYWRQFLRIIGSRLEFC